VAGTRLELEHIVKWPDDRLQKVAGRALDRRLSALHAVLELLLHLVQQEANRFGHVPDVGSLAARGRERFK
jgi:hypothetical protein